MMYLQPNILLLVLLTLIRIHDAFLFVSSRPTMRCNPLFVNSDKSVETIPWSYQTSFHSNSTNVRNTLLRRWLVKKLSRNNRKAEKPSNNKVYRFSYQCNRLIIDGRDKSNSTTVGMMLIHPIGVGISKWYYDRLLNSLANQNQYANRLLILAPDLLGSGSASEPLDIASGERLRTFPLLNITDWSNQLMSLMADYESRHKADESIQKWVIVANGGCSPIALKVAQSSVTNTATSNAPVTNVILSSPLVPTATSVLP